jgi:5-enolpyruvylshikimate-3-phosphate synthase
MALALLGTLLPHGVAVAHDAAVAKSWPGFFAWLARTAHVAHV